MLETTKNNREKFRNHWQNKEAQHMLRDIIKVVRSRQPLQPYLYSLPMIDEEGCIFWDLQGAPLLNVDLSDGDMREAMISHADLRGANLQGADLREASLYYANLEGANLEGANLEKCDVTGANFTGANLAGANFKNNSLFRNSLIEANLYQTDFSGASLRRVSLIKANLFQTNFTNASLRNVEFAEDSMKRAIVRNTTMIGSGSEYVASKKIDESQMDITQVLSSEALQAIEELERMKTIVDSTPRSSN